MNFIDRGDLASADLDLITIPNFDDGNLHTVDITDYLPETAKASSNKAVLIRLSIDAKSDLQGSQLRTVVSQDGDVNGFNASELDIDATLSDGGGSFYAEGEDTMLIHCNADNKIQFSISTPGGGFKIGEALLIVKGVFV